jgi:hypothetical protein
MDDRVLPCQDFWNYACHNWVTSNPMPPWASKWSIRDEIAHQGNTLTFVVNFSPIDYWDDFFRLCYGQKRREGLGI